LSSSKFCQDQTTILLNDLQPVFSTLLSRCIASEADFAVVESAVKTALEVVRATLISRGLDISVRCSPHHYLCPTCGETLTGWNNQSRHVMTAVGGCEITVTRYRCGPCEVDYYPVLEGNCLVGEHFTLGAKERIASQSADDGYALVSRKMRELGIEISAKEVDRQARDVGALLHREQDSETQWHLEDQRQRTEATFVDRPNWECEGLGTAPEAMFSWAGWEGQTCAQISVDGAKARSPEMGTTGLVWFDVRTGLIRPVTKKSSAQPFHTSGVMSWDEMFDRLWAVWRQRPAGLKDIVFVSDDGAGIKCRAKSRFEGATIVADLYHAAEHLASLACALWEQDSLEAIRYKTQSLSLLNHSNGPQDLIREFVEAAKNTAIADPDEFRTNLRYLWRNRHYMKYERWQQEGLPIGSGAVESAIKQICVKRLRGAGMKWTREGADRILQIRAASLAGTLHVPFQREHQRARQAFNRFLQPSRYRIAV
jgi:hypothetical protein